MVNTEINKLEFSNVQNLNLRHTFECGQCFRWESVGDEYVGVVFGKEVRVSLSGTNLVLYFNSECGSADVWKDYFDLNLHYNLILQNLKGIHPVLSEAVSSCAGIRILKQDPWETLCSFIISQNNNIPRIKGIISRLCENFGDRIVDRYTFPTVERIATLSEADLLPIRCGFRSKYILDAARRIVNGDVPLNSLYDMPIDEARTVLMTINGVGPKVAECTLLYGFHRLEAFPLDVWMKKIMDSLFKGISKDVFGEFAGIAQQYLYHYVRSNPQLLD